MEIDESTRNELVTEVFSSIFDRDFTLLRRFRGESSLATYLTIIARRIVVKRLQGMKALGTKSSSELSPDALSDAGLERRIDSRSSIDQAVPAPSTAEPLVPNAKAHPEAH